MRKAVLLLCIVALGVLFILSGCKAPEEAPEGPEVPEVPEVPAEPELPPEVAEGNWLAGVECAQDTISAVITNQGDSEATILKDIKVLLRGLVVTAVDCDKMTLAPGESAICGDISGGFPLAASNLIIVRAPGAVQETVTVVCE